MKKKFIPFITAIIAVAVTLGGCSCTGTTPLVFNDGFNGGTSASYPYKETLTYDVDYIKSYGDNFTKSPQLSDDALNIEISGTYTVTLEVIDRNDSSKLQNIQSDLLADGVDVGSSIYNLKTHLDITSTYSTGKEGENPSSPEKKEFITTDAYFLSSGFSFNPLYSETNGHTSLVVADDEGLSITFMDYSTKIEYNKGDYVITAKYGNTDQPVKEYGYSYKTAIDNNTLLFALRNISLDVDGQYNLDVVHASYGDPQNLVVKNLAERTENFEINDISESVKVKEYSFVRNVQNSTGTPQYVVIQKEKTENLANRSLLIQYTAPMSCYNSFICLGGLQYTLKTVS